MDGEILLLHVNLVGTGLPYPALGADKLFRHKSLASFDFPVCRIESRVNASVPVLRSSLFAGVGGLIGSLIAPFGGPSLHNMSSLTWVYVLVGILEARNRRFA
jgi:hypothetical protein